MHPLPRTVCLGHRNSPSRLSIVHFFWSKMLPTILQVCRDMSQPSVEKGFTPTPGPPLRIMLESLSHSKAGRRVTSHSTLPDLNVSVLALAPDERSFRRFWAVVEQSEGVESALEVVEAVHVLASVLTHSEKLRTANNKRTRVVRHALSTMQKPFYFNGSASTAKCSHDACFSSTAGAHSRAGSGTLDRAERSTDSISAEYHTR